MQSNRHCFINGGLAREVMLILVICLHLNSLLSDFILYFYVCVFICFTGFTAASCVFNKYTVFKRKSPTHSFFHISMNDVTI